jgi:predicted acetyltransferase
LDLELVAPDPIYWPSYRGFVEEMRACGDTVWPGRWPQDAETPEAWIGRLLRGADPAEPLPTTVSWGLAGPEVVGVLVVRHRLTEALARYGGQVSYEVRPSWRRRGVGTAMLRRALASPLARQLGVLRVTCAPDNMGSRQVIERNGGRLVGWSRAGPGQRETCLYDLAAADPEAGAGPG